MRFRKTMIVGAATGCLIGAGLATDYMMLRVLYPCEYGDKAQVLAHIDDLIRQLEPARYWETDAIDAKLFACNAALDKRIEARRIADKIAEENYLRTHPAVPKAAPPAPEAAPEAAIAARRIEEARQREAAAIAEAKLQARRIAEAKLEAEEAQQRKAAAEAARAAEEQRR